MVTNREWVCVLDFGSQYTQLIARRIRELHVYCEVHPCTVDPSEILPRNPCGLIFSGGPRSVTDRDAPTIPEEFLADGHPPILGICYGLQALCQTLGGKVVPSETREYGHATLSKKSDSPLFRGLADTFQVWMSHGDRVDRVPDGFSITAGTGDIPCAALENSEAGIYGLQFHPEVTHTPDGRSMLGAFVSDICKAKGDWQLEDFARESIEEIREQVGDSSVILALSGGVDSMVASTLLSRAIGDRLHAIFVDNGLLRTDEREEVRKAIEEHTEVSLHVVDATDRFLKALDGITDPEEKRRRIGHTFIDVFKDAAAGIPDCRFLAQGTLYPDVIESVPAFGGPTDKIKTHHNVGGLPEQLGFELIEPFRMLFKDEVRALGEKLQLPESVVWRQPFPGPGLAVRILGEITTQRLSVLREADSIVRHEIEDAGLSRKLWQWFAVLVPMQSVGVMGDQRTYEDLIALRIVTSTDAMTCDWARLDHDLLAGISNRIVNEVRGVNRVAYDISTKPPATIEWE